MSDDPVEDVADAMVAFLEGASEWATPPSMNFTVIKDAVPDAQIEKIVNTTVFVVPFGEAAQKIGRGGEALETYQVFVVVVRPMNADFTRPKLAKLARQLKLAIRRNRKMAGYPWAGDETTAKFNTGLGRENNLFLCGTQFDFTGTA